MEKSRISPSKSLSLISIKSSNFSLNVEYEQNGQKNKIKKVCDSEKLSLLEDRWNPRIVGELNGQYVKLVKARGEFDWHKHNHEDEMFFFVKGEFNMELGDETISIRERKFIVIPKGVEHRPVGKEEVPIMLFEPTSTVNTGDNYGSRLTQKTLRWI